MGSGGGMNVVEMFIAGGWVMYPILALSVVSLAITFERISVVFFERRRSKPTKTLDEFIQLLEKNKNDKITTINEISAQLKKKTGILGELLLSAFHKYIDGTQKKMSPLELKQWMTTAVESQANVELPHLEYHLSALAVISNVSTLMGLFGTVIGMIESFTAMSNSPGGVKADEMAGGIAIALVATAGGLTVAVPSLLLYNFIKGHIEKYVTQMEETVVRIIDLLAE